MALSQAAVFKGEGQAEEEVLTKETNVENAGSPFPFPAPT